MPPKALQNWINQERSLAETLHETKVHPLRCAFSPPTSPNPCPLCFLVPLCLVIWLLSMGLGLGWPQEMSHNTPNSLHCLLHCHPPIRVTNELWLGLVGVWGPEGGPDRAHGTGGGGGGGSMLWGGSEDFLDPNLS